VTTATGPSQTPDAPLPLHVDPGYRQAVLSARRGLAELLGQIAGGLRDIPAGPSAGRETPVLVDDTIAALAHAEALLAAAGRKLDGIKRAARQTAARRSIARRRVLDTEPTVTIEALREMYVNQLLTCQEIAARCGKSGRDVADVLTSEGVTIQRGRRNSPAARAASRPTVSPEPATTS
jgi:hypothetical protein